MPTYVDVIILLSVIMRFYDGTVKIMQYDELLFLAGRSYIMTQAHKSIPGCSVNSEKSALRPLSCHQCALGIEHGMRDDYGLSDVEMRTQDDDN
jgi:hypothetical protein